jgi:hypothetical protein
MSECILWDKQVDKDGYGKAKYKGKTWRAHRLVYFLQHGEIPPGMMVLHNCDTPRCVNAEHLFLGSCLDNRKDMLAKRREYVPKGALAGQTKLTEEQVLAIRDSNLACAKLSKMFGVCRAQIQRIKRRERWAWLCQAG